MEATTERLTAALGDRYQIERPLGEGGMATVFLAEDLKHDRRVAIKVLKPELAAVIGGERFVSEIKMTARLQHPHILPLFDSGETDGFLYYVMPYVEGESLRERLGRERQLGVDHAVGITRAVASALHYAHERGIVHRDIKPANILIHADEPVVADFGIALAISAAGGGRLTETGMSVGTPHYMSPEQASGDREVTARSDVYSLACVLYEMLTGDPPHTGPTAQAVLMRILTEEPRDVGDVRRSVPEHVRAALVRALEKLPADRFDSAEDFARALGDETFGYRPGTRTRVRAGLGVAGGDGARSWLRDPRTLVTLGLIGALAGGLGWTLLAGSGALSSAGVASPQMFVVRDTTIDAPLIGLSHRGDLVYRSEGGLRVRRARDGTTIDLPGIDAPFRAPFSPEGDWIAFADGAEIRKVQPSTGTVVTLVSASAGFDQVITAHWGTDRHVYFGSRTGIHRVPDVGGDIEQIVDRPNSAFPFLLPDERTLLYTDVGGANFASARTVVLDLETGDTLGLDGLGGNAQWSPTGHILAGHTSGVLFAVPFDLERRVPTGPPVPVREAVLSFGGVAMFDVSSTGSLAHVAAVDDLDIDRRVFEWIEADGSTTPIPLEPTDHGDADLSPDGRRLAYTRADDIWIYDLEGGADQRFTFEGEGHHDPVWSPDGRRIAFASIRPEGRGSVDVYVKDADGRSPAAWLAGGAGEDYPAEWLEDGTVVVFTREAAGAQTDIATTSVDGDGSLTGLLEAAWDETAPAISPDGRYMAYLSNETGEHNVFVREFPGMSGPWQISAGPTEGRMVWAPDGRSLVYQPTGNNPAIRAELELEPTVRVVRRTRLVDARASALLIDAHPDDDRVLVEDMAGAAALEERTPDLVVVVNWITELRERLGPGNP